MEQFSVPKMERFKPDRGLEIKQRIFEILDESGEANNHSIAANLEMTGLFTAEQTGDVVAGIVRRTREKNGTF